jgi:hypothetical protein
MRGYAFATMNHFHSGDGVADLHRLLHQLIGHRIVVAVEFDVIVEPDSLLLPLGEHIRLAGQGLQGRAVQFLSEISARLHESLQA